MDEGHRLGELLLLLHSARDAVSGPYLDGLERTGIPVRCEPAGHVRVPAGDELLVTTIHQTKGREWDVVVAGSLCAPTWPRTALAATSRTGACTPASPGACLIGDFDRARQHYVAFTRARRLLVLTASGAPEARFRPMWDGSARWPDTGREALARQRFGDAGARAGEMFLETGHLDRLVVNLARPG